MTAPNLLAGPTRTLRRAANGLRLLGGLDRPRTGCTPYAVIWRSGKATLRRYQVPRAGNPQHNSTAQAAPRGVAALDETPSLAGGRRLARNHLDPPTCAPDSRRGAQAGADQDRPAVLLVPSLINRSHIWDLRPGDSFVEGLLGNGYDVFLIDWGVADERDAGNTLATYVDEYLPAAYAAATEAAGSPPAVLGHCFGGVVATLWAASAAEQPPALVALGVPTNWREMGPLSHVTQQGRLDPEDVLDATGNVPPTTLLRAFQMLRPLGDLAGYVTLWDRLDDRKATQAIWALTDWAHDHVPFPGATFVDLVRDLSRANALNSGEVVLGDRVRRLADLTCPFLNVYGKHDHITPPASVMPLAGLVGSEKVETVALRAGHIGLLVGGSARKQTLPAVTGWLTSVGFGATV